jgi:ABC-type antimicrobial peptide transport system permease subunit
MFSGVALLLSTVGLYGLLSYHVSRQANEIGIRLAMGASNINVFGMILKRGLSLVGIGLAAGVAGAYSGSLLIRQLLFETQLLDPATYFSAATFLGFAAALACLLPAWRATRINPVEVLRRE